MRQPHDQTQRSHDQEELPGREGRFAFQRDEAVTPRIAGVRAGIQGGHAQDGEDGGDGGDEELELGGVGRASVRMSNQFLPDHVGLAGLAGP